MPAQRESLREGAISAGATSRNSEGNSGAILGSAIPFYGIVGPFFHSKFFDFRSPKPVGMMKILGGVVTSGSITPRQNGLFKVKVAWGHV